MDPHVIQALLNAGGLGTLSAVITLLHLYNVRVAIPQMQQMFHDEMSRERAFWAEELRLVRTNTERRHMELVQAIVDGTIRRRE
jgi:hypothetical protein